MDTLKIKAMACHEKAPNKVKSIKTMVLDTFAFYDPL